MDVTYAIDYTVNNAGVPIKYSLDGMTWTDDIADVVATDLSHAAGSNTKTITLQWEWESTGDAADTALGTATPPAEPNVKATVTFAQKTSSVRYLPNEKGNLSFKTGIVAKQATS